MISTELPPLKPLEKPCRLWREGETKHGRIYIKGRGLVSPHRLAYEQAYGPIPDGLMVCHRCDNPPCIEPTHFFLGTNQQNQLDASRKGRLRGQDKTECVNGHPYDGTHLRRSGRRTRRCLTCHREEERRRLARKHQARLAVAA